VLYYVAYSKRRHRAEFAVGPALVAKFQEGCNFRPLERVSVNGWEAAAGNYYGVSGQNSEWQRLSALATYCTMRGDWAGAFDAWKRAQVAAMKDPAWWTMVVTTLEGTATPPKSGAAGAAEGAVAEGEGAIGGPKTPEGESPSSQAGGKGVPATPTTGPTVRPRATPQQLREMIANQREYFTWRTTEGDVAASQPIRFTGKNTKAGAPAEWAQHAREGVYVTRGVKGVGYGEYRVAVKGEGFRILPTSDAMEFIIDGEIPASQGVWYTAEDYAKAVGGQ
jgi:hypothetical protein